MIARGLGDGAALDDAQYGDLYDATLNGGPGGGAVTSFGPGSGAVTSFGPGGGAFSGGVATGDMGLPGGAFGGSSFAGSATPGASVSQYGAFQQPQITPGVDMSAYGSLAPQYAQRIEQPGDQTYLPPDPSNPTPPTGAQGQTGASTSSAPPWQLTPQQIGQLAPAPLQAFGGLTSVNPTYGEAAYAQAPQTPNAALLNPSLTSAAQQGVVGARAAQVDPRQSTQFLNEYGALLDRSLAPQFQQQQMQLQDSLAARGISNSGAAGELQGNLLGQQAGAYASALSPMVQQGYSYSQADIAANQANRQQTGLANAGFQNAALGANAGYQQQANLANQQYSSLANQSNQAAVNAFTAQGYSYQQATALANQSNQQQMNLANMSTANAATATNAGYYNQAQNENAAAYNGYQNLLFNAAQGTYASELGAFLNSFGPNTGVQSLMGTGLAGTQNAYSNIYNAAISGQSAALGSLGAGFGQAAMAGG